MPIYAPKMSTPNTKTRVSRGVQLVVVEGLSKSQDQLSCRESKENKESKVRQAAQVLRRRRTLSGDPRKAHRGEEAKARPTSSVGLS